MVGTTRPCRIFGELKIGETFKFKFDMCSDWKYKKVSITEVECIEAPRTERNCIGRIEPYRHEWSEVMTNI